MDTRDAALDTPITPFPRKVHAHEPKRTRRFAAILSLLSLAVRLLVAAGALFVLVTIGGKAEEGYQLRQQARALQQHIDQLQTDNRQLSQKLDYYRSDQYIEKIAREQLGLVRPGDVPVIVVPPDGTPEPDIVTPTVTPTSTAPPSPIWQRWLSIFVDQR